MENNKKDLLKIEGEIKSQIEHNNRKIAYINYMVREKKEFYDVDFVNFYRNGQIIINDKEYRTSSLYLESGLSNGKDSLFLVYYAFPQKDLLTQKEKSNFKRTGLMEFRKAYVFYQLYVDYSDDITDNKLQITDKNKNAINDLVQSYDGSTHMETPETSYGKVNTQ
jgi:hypothetical protein